MACCVVSASVGERDSWAACTEAPEGRRRSSYGVCRRQEEPGKEEDEEDGWSVASLAKLPARCL